MISIEEAKTRVARGAAYFDRTRPNWFNEIDTGRLKMSCCGRCIAGQLGGQNTFTQSCELLGFLDIEAPAYGMDLTTEEWFFNTGPREDLWTPLTDAWIEAIAIRRFPSIMIPTNTLVTVAGTING